MDADHWNDRYAASEYVWTTGANALLVAEVSPLAPGRALDLACGEGRNAVWLAEQGESIAADRRFRLRGMVVGGNWWQGAAG